MKKRVLVYFLIILILFILISFFIFLISNTDKSEFKDNTVINIIDGDTFQYYDLDSKTIKTVRLLCVDTPEISEPGYEQAKFFLENLILGKQITLEKDISETDKYERLLRYVYVDDVFVNKLILEKGYGKLLIIPPDECKRLIH